MINYDDNNGDSNDDDTAEGWNGDYEYMELENVTFDLTRFFIFISFIEKLCRSHCVAGVVPTHHRM